MALLPAANPTHTGSLAEGEGAADLGGSFRLKVMYTPKEEEGVGSASRLAKQNCHEENYDVN